jgi:hypothetical protein
MTTKTLFISLMLCVSGIARADLAPQPSPTPPPPPPSCNTMCDSWETDYPNICPKPYVNHKRYCNTSCGGNYMQELERNCVPVADYMPIYLSGYVGSGEYKTEETPFKTDLACNGQWWVNIRTEVWYTGGSANPRSTVWTECRKP